MIKKELVTRQKLQDEKRALSKSRSVMYNKRKHAGGNGGGGNGGGGSGGSGSKGKKINNEGYWKKQLKKAVKAQNRLKTIISVLALEETENQVLIQALEASTTTLPTGTMTNASTIASDPLKEFPRMSFPDTSLKLSATLKGSKT